MPPQPPDPGDCPLSRLRGPEPAQPYTARKITALTANPACSRRAVLDASGVDKAALATRLGHEARFGRSPLALTRERAFKSLVKWGAYAELIRLLRQQLSVPVEEAGVVDIHDAVGLEDEPDDPDDTAYRKKADATLPRRANATRRLIEQVASDSEQRLILDHPVLCLEVAGQIAYLEPDALTHRIGGKFYLTTIRSFAAIDGQANPTSVSQAAKQTAVYILALRRTFEAAGLDPQQVADRFLLICPKDFSNRPYGRLVDVQQELDALEFQLNRLRRAEDIAALLPPDATLDANRSLGELQSSLADLDASYTPDCLSFCEMARYCRDEAGGCASPARLGSAIRNALPGIDSTRIALAHLDGTGPASADETEAIELLRTADRLRRLRGGNIA
ncbi:hypothetical protein [Streptomyces sp. NPDC048442]|uniref:hypothetical protein n=1 Tax=Streptomyces sp. NPDC048442 TaxID=3154823 RepID=UPI003438D878